MINVYLYIKYICKRTKLYNILYLLIYKNLNFRGENDMSGLKDDSKLYNQLAEIYEKNKEHISLDVFKECVEIAKKSEKTEIKYVLFKLKCLYEDPDTGIDKINVIGKIIKLFAGDNFKCSFVIAVLETALEDM